MPRCTTLVQIYMALEKHPSAHFDPKPFLEPRGSFPCHIHIYRKVQLSMWSYEVKVLKMVRMLMGLKNLADLKSG